jgi:hypothetical protein
MINFLNPRGASAYLELKSNVTIASKSGERRENVNQNNQTQRAVIWLQVGMSVKQFYLHASDDLTKEMIGLDLVHPHFVMLHKRLQNRHVSHVYFAISNI